MKIFITKIYMTKKHYKTVFVSDIHLGNPRNQWDKLNDFLESISFENLIIIGDFIDYRQLARFWKWWEKEQKTLDYINKLAKSWINITYLQWNHDRNLKCWDTIKIENMTIYRDLYYQTSKWKTYYVTHWDCIDWINKNGNKLWQIWTITSWLLLKFENLRNKKVLNNDYISIAEKLEEQVKKWRMPESKIKNKLIKFTKTLNCDWIILWHFHTTRHYSVNWIDYFNTWDWIRNCSAVVEDKQWKLNLIFYK